jgi:hypothetical protein
MVGGFSETPLSCSFRRHTISATVLGSKLAERASIAFAGSASTPRSSPKPSRPGHGSMSFQVIAPRGQGFTVSK